MRECVLIQNNRLLNELVLAYRTHTTKKSEGNLLVYLILIDFVGAIFLKLIHNIVDIFCL